MDKSKWKHYNSNEAKGSAGTWWSQGRLAVIREPFESKDGRKDSNGSVGDAGANKNDVVREKPQRQWCENWLRRHLR